MIRAGDLGSFCQCALGLLFELSCDLNIDSLTSHFFWTVFVQEFHLSAEHVFCWPSHSGSKYYFEW